MCGLVVGRGLGRRVFDVMLMQDGVILVRGGDGGGLLFGECLQVHRGSGYGDYDYNFYDPLTSNNLTLPCSFPTAIAMPPVPPLHLTAVTFPNGVADVGQFL